MLRSGIFPLLLAIGIAGCSSSTDATPGSDELSKYGAVFASGPTALMGPPGELPDHPPAVILASRRTGKPIAGVTVSFSISGPGAATYSRVTDASGIAQLDHVAFSATPGEYTMIAEVNGAGSVKFNMLSFSDVVLATYDVQSIGGRPVPIFLADTIALTGAHYQLFEGGTYRYGYDTNHVTSWYRRGRFAYDAPGKISFYVDPSYVDPSYVFLRTSNYLIGIGYPAGNKMTVTYNNPLEAEDEVYVLRQ